MNWCNWCGEYERFNTKLHGKGFCGDVWIDEPNKICSECGNRI